VAEIHSKHGLILSCTLTLPDDVDASLVERLNAMTDKLAQQRYGFVDQDAVVEAQEETTVKDVGRWLQAEMGS